MWHFKDELMTAITRLKYGGHLSEIFKRYKYHIHLKKTTTKNIISFVFENNLTTFMKKQKQKTFTAKIWSKIFFDNFWHNFHVKGQTSSINGPSYLRLILKGSTTHSTSNRVVTPHQSLYFQDITISEVSKNMRHKAKPVSVYIWDWCQQMR